jgi:hypothetical protein
MFSRERRVSHNFHKNSCNNNNKGKIKSKTIHQKNTNNNTTTSTTTTGKKYPLGSFL